MDLQINSVDYRTGSIPVMKQLQIARRLAPLFSAAASEDADKGLMTRIADAAAKLTDADTEHVIGICLDVCLRKQGDKFTPVRARGQIMFVDIDLPTVMQLTFACIQENMGSFFSGNQQAFVAPST